MTNPQHSDQNPHGHDHDTHPSDLHEPVNWMSYSHQMLYDMLTKDVDLASAQHVRDGWTSLGGVLNEVQTLLNTAIKDSDTGWEGEAAEKAREGLGNVSKWTGDAALYTNKVGTLIDTEIKNVSDAIHAMPPPPQPAQPPVPVPPQPQQLSGFSMFGAGISNIRAEQMFGADAAQQIAASQVQTNQFANAAQIGAASVETVIAGDAAHQQAADVMAAFQRNSATVDQTVPQLAPPVNPVAPPGGGQVGTMKTPTGGPADGSGAGAGGPVMTGPMSGQTDTRASSSRGGGYGYGRMPMTTGGSGGGSGGFGRTFMPPAASAAGSGAAGGGALGGGSAGAASESVRGGGVGGAAAAAQNVNQTKAFQNPLQMGAAPMAGAPGAAGHGSEDEREYKHAAYLEEDDNVFGLDRKAAPPVIGQ